MGRKALRHTVTGQMSELGFPERIRETEKMAEAYDTVNRQKNLQEHKLSEPE